MLGYFGGAGAEARRAYRRFVLEWIGEGHRDEYYEAVEGRMFGDTKFVEDVKARLGERERPRVKIKPEAFVKKGL